MCSCVRCAVAGCLYCVLRRARACKALSIIIAVSNQGDASGMVDALTAVIMYLHGDHFWPVLEARLAPPPLAFNQIGLSLVRWTAAGWGVVCILWECVCVWKSVCVCVGRKEGVSRLAQPLCLKPAKNV